MGTLLKRILHPRQDESLFNVMPKAIKFLNPTDWMNIVKYGSPAPRYADVIYVNPQDVQGILMPRARSYSGVVVREFPPTSKHTIIPVRDHGKIGCCLEKWERGIAWSETKYLKECLKNQIYRYGKTPSEQNQFWSKYDELLEDVKRDGRLKLRSEFNNSKFRQEGGVIIHIGEGGALYQGHSGNRRFAAALFAGLTEIPAQVGCVHVGALEVFRSMCAPRAATETDMQR